MVHRSRVVQRFTGRAIGLKFKFTNAYYLPSMETTVGIVCHRFWKIKPCKLSLRRHPHLLRPHVSCSLQFALCQRMRAFLASTARSFSLTSHPPGPVSVSEGRGTIPAQAKQQLIDDQNKSGVYTPEEGDTAKVTRSNLENPETIFGNRVPLHLNRRCVAESGYQVSHTDKHTFYPCLATLAVCAL